jgi:uncharacterized protein YegP (UPF0339 family)
MAKKKPCKKPVGNGARFETFQGVNGDYYFRLIAPNDECIAVSEGYQTEEGLLNGIKSVQKFAKGATVRQV